MPVVVVRLEMGYGAITTCILDSEGDVWEHAYSAVAK